MLFNTVILALIGTASAVDIVFWDGPLCKGKAMACVNQNPDTCCRNGAGVPSVSVQAIPKEWNLNTVGYSDNDCINQVNVLGTYGTDYGCMNMYGGGTMSSVKYGFGQGSGKVKTRRRRRAGKEENEKCKEVHRPDVMIFSGGAKYNLTSLDEDTYKKMVCDPVLPSSIGLVSLKHSS